jgi:hypothetical protein
MMPQSSFMVLAPIDARREADLRSLLESMNDGPGRTKAINTLVPFSRFDTLHVARFVIIDDKTVGDVAAYGLKPIVYPLYLAFVGDVDGDGDAFLAAAAREASDGLRAIFSCCDGFKPGTDLLRWMKKHSVRSAATYVNWRGRTVRRSREDAALFDSLQKFIQTSETDICALPARDAHTALRKHALAEVAAGRLTLSAEPETPLGWRIADFLHLVGVPLIALAASPILVPAAVLAVLRLRALEKTDAELCARVDDAYSNGLSDLEDHDVTNQFTAMGSIKPGLVRRWSVAAAFFAIDYAARHIFTRGGLARVRTIHFARWVFLDGKKRAVFMSNYDGSLESYMDDFINKVGFGLNIAFSGGIGYPATKWLVGDGCNDERKFKEYLRRHQLPTQVWYKAYPGLTAIDLERNGRIRDGLEQSALTEQGAREWVGLL